MSLAMIALVEVMLAAAAPSLVGSWTLMGQPFATFDKSGSCTMDGDPCTWRVNGTTLFITGEGETEALPFAVTAGTLTLTVNGIPIALERAGKAPVTTSPTPTAPATLTGEPKLDLNDPLAKLLLSSAWCTFWFNKTTGYSGSTRSVLFPDGSYQTGGKSEGYSSGYAGTFASEGRSGNSGRWAVSKGQLWMTPAPTEINPTPPLVLVTDLVVKRNSSGAPIITAAGTEYSQCQ